MRKTRKQIQKGEMNKYLSIITSNINELNAPIKRCRVAEWKRKQTCISATYKRFTSEKRPALTEHEGLEKIFQRNGQEKKAEVAILIYQTK